jgi:hypothetical protein
MSKENSLSQIIREVTEHAKPIPSKEELVTIDVRTAQAVSQPGFFGAMTGEFRYFLVSNNQDAYKIIRGVNRVKYREDQQEIVLAIAYEGGCRPGQEWRLAQCFFESSLSEDAINGSLAKWLIEYFSSGTLTIDDFSSESTNAGIALATKASQKFGLDLKINLRLEGTDKLDTIEVGPVLISSRLKGSDAEESIWFKAELEVDQQRVLRALLSQNKPLTELLKKGVRKYFGEHITFDNFYKDLNTEQIKQGLSHHLNNLLKPLGRTVGFLLVKPADADSHPHPFKGDTVIEYQHHEYPDPIKIKISVLMIPTNPARYKAKGSPKLNVWLDNSLREVITLALFGISYVDLLLDFEQLKRKIGDSMNQRAEEIGYHIEQLMTILYLEPFEWLKRIDIEIKGAAPNNGQITEAMFETSLSNFYVGLEIILTARIKDLRGISDYLTTKLDVPQRMKEEITRLVRRFMHGTDPERFYMRYSQTDNNAYPDEIPFEVELRQKIHSLLEMEFNAEVIDLVLKPMQTELTRKLDEISKGAHDFAVAAELGSLPGAPTIIVKGSFKVDGVNGWQAFKQCDASVEAIQKRIGDSVRARLKGARDDQLNFSEQAGINKLIENVLLAARELVRDEFGLAIRLTTIHWDWDDELKHLGRLQGKKELASVQERILKLNELLLDLHENDASPEDIKNVEESIRRLGATLKPALASSIGIQQLSEPKPTKSLSSSETDQSDW